MDFLNVKVLLDVPRFTGFRENRPGIIPYTYWFLLGLAVLIEEIILSRFLGLELTFDFYEGGEGSSADGFYAGCGKGWWIGIGF